MRILYIIDSKTKVNGYQMPMSYNNESSSDADFFEQGLPVNQPNASEIVVHHEKVLKHCD